MKIVKRNSSKGPSRGGNSYGGGGRSGGGSSYGGSRSGGGRSGGRSSGGSSYGGGRSGGGNSYGGGSSSWKGTSSGERPETHKAVCGDCGKDCVVPFRPSGSKPVLCSFCFRGTAGGGERHSNVRTGSGRSFERRSSSDDRKPSNPDLRREMAEVNKKLDNILALLTGALDGDDEDSEEDFEDDEEGEDEAIEDIEIENAEADDFVFGDA